jgi:uncharacterized protein YkwD
VTWCGAFAVVLGLLNGCGVPATTTSPRPSVPTPADYAATLLAATNAARTAEDLPSLAPSVCATTSAAGRAEALAGRGVLEHAPLGPVLRECAPATTAAENLSLAEVQPADVVDAWMQSPGHRANILDAGLSEIGVACVPDADKMLCAEVFLGP